MSYTSTFSQLGKNDIPTAGGKGANLGELTAAGLPVPAGFVLTTGAYGAFVQANGLQEQIVVLAGMVSAENPQSAQHASEQIGALFIQGAMSDELATEITNAYEQLTHASGSAVAVRSSATAEDLPSASFAGQQDTFLNIRGHVALLDAVKKCWASLWTARALAYRLRQGIEPASVRLAVVVQVLISAAPTSTAQDLTSGILFTANPINGERGQTLINAAWGLGEAIVGGLVTPDTIVVDKASDVILSRDTAIKTRMTVRTETGTEEQTVPESLQAMQVLDDASVIKLAQFGEQIEAHYGMPMDIEWAIADGEIAILQARPITSLPAAPLKDVVWEPIAPKTLWLRRQIVEHMPEPLSPLFEDLYLTSGLRLAIGEMLSNMSKFSGADLDLDRFMPHGFAATINGYAYTTGSAKLTPSLVWQVIKIYARIHKMFKMHELDWEGHVLPTYQDIVARWDAIDLDTTPNATLLAGIAEMSAADSSYWFGSALNLGLSRALDPLFDRLLKSFLFRRALPKVGVGSSAFLRGFDSKALDAQADMEALADMIRDSAELRTLTINTSAKRLLNALSIHPDGQPILDGINDYLDAYGHQIYNLDFAAPTQIEDPQAMLLSLKVLVEHSPAQAVRTRQAKMAADCDALVEQTAQALNPVSRRLFRWVWKWTKYYAPYREHVMFYMGLAWPTVRKLSAELGQRLAALDTIATPDDIYYLNSSEITAAINAQANAKPAPDFVQLAQERRELRESQKLLTPQPKIPERGSLKFGPIDLSMFDPTPTDALNKEGPILNGYAVSTGRVTAPASVIHSIDEFDKMKPDSILVCTTTTPAWTPLFSQAAGLVTDVGGALAHGSIVAREYGIPAVMGTGVATERIKSGMILVVDGDVGTVVLE
ncbi:MAG: PEP/pyruvate-binding domain-containing protein [Candidatus Promineifilaceae bacterium]